MQQGRFLLKGDINEKTIVVVSYIGYEKEQIVVGTNTFLSVKLKVTEDELDKVVVQAYGTTTQRLATGKLLLRLLLKGN